MFASDNKPSYLDYSPFVFKMIGGKEREHKCDKCSNWATNHLTTIKKGKSTEEYLCGGCIIGHQDFKLLIG